MRGNVCAVCSSSSLCSELRHGVAPQLTRRAEHRQWRATVRSSASIFGITKNLYIPCRTLRLTHTTAQRLLSAPMPRIVPVNVQEQRSGDLKDCTNDFSYCPPPSTRPSFLFVSFLLVLLPFSLSDYYSIFHYMSIQNFFHSDKTITVYVTLLSYCAITFKKETKTENVSSSGGRWGCLLCFFFFFLWFPRHFLRRRLPCLRRATRLRCPSRATWPRTPTT